MNQTKAHINQLSIDRTQIPASNNKYRYYIVTLIALLLMFIVFINSESNNSRTVTPDAQLTEVDNNPSDLLEKNASSHLNVNSSKVEKTSRVLDASGHIVARRIATISSRVTGKIEQLNIEEGQKIKTDQVLAELDDQQAKISFRIAEAELLANRAIHQELTLVYRHELKLFERRKILLKDHLISEEIVETSETKTQQLAIQLKKQNAQIELATARLALAQYQLDQHKIRAPFDGVVISKNAQVGELISAGSSGGGFIRTGVATIVDMSSLEIEVEVGESYINRVFPGQVVEARLDAYPEWQIKSEVVAVIPTADRQKATIKVRVKLLQVDSKILPDMGVKVSFFG